MAMKKQKAEIVPNLSDTDIDFISYEPTERMKQYKAQFWMSIKDSPILDPTSMSISAITNLARGSENLRQELLKPEVRSWFFNHNTAQVMIQAAAEQAVATLISIMTTENVHTTSSRVKAAELILKYAGLEPSKKIDVNNSKDDRSSEELDAFLEEGLRKLNYVKLESSTIDIEEQSSSVKEGGKDE
jgi:hypothetical protein